MFVCLETIVTSVYSLDRKWLFLASSVATSLGSEASLPSSTIGVVGESGHGKSSLLNALLDHTDILPTSGMKACTAVVIEVGDNGAQSMYEARIDFISKEVGLKLIHVSVVSFEGFIIITLWMVK